MTEQLLDRALFGNDQAFRKGLRDAAFERVGEFRGGTLEASCLPLFTQSQRGLEQIVRFHCDAIGYQVRIEINGSIVGPSAFTDGEDGPMADLIVPAVTTPTDATFVVADGANELVRGQFVVRPQRKWTISLIHCNHLDIGYTDRQPVVMKNHVQYLDSVLELIERTSGWPEDSRFRWNVEVTWPLERWFAVRGERDRKRMLEAIEAGDVGVCAMSLNVHSEACSIEELYEMVRFAITLRREQGVPVKSAMQTDVPGCVTGLAEVLADAGVPYLAVAHNLAGRGVPYLVGGEKLERPFYWRLPSGKRVLVWFTDTARGNAYMEGAVIGLSESYERSAATLPYYLHALGTRPYPFTSGIWLPGSDAVAREPYPHDFLQLRLLGKRGDNSPPNLAVAETARRWNETWAYPRLRVDLNDHFFESVERRLGESIPEWRGGWDDWWADGLGSAARLLGWARSAQDALRQGRTLHALADMLAGEAVSRPEPLRELYEELSLFDEHTWGAREPWSDEEDGYGSGGLQWQHKSSFAHRAREGSETLLLSGARQAVAALNARLPATAHGAKKSLADITVINTSGQARTDMVRAFVPFSTVPEDEAVVVLDRRDGRRLPTQALAQVHANHRPAGRFLLFRADAVPSLGFARFAAVAGSPVTVEGNGSDVTYIENEFYRVSYSAKRGCIESIEGLDSKRQLVAEASLFGLNSYIFERYGTANRVQHLSGKIFSDDLALIADRSTGEAAVLLRRETSELGETMSFDVRAPGCTRLVTTVSTWRGVPRVELENRLWKSPTSDKQSVFFAFPFQDNDSHLIYEMPGVAIREDGPSVPGSPQHMRAIRHWVALQESHGGIAWATAEAALVQFHDLHSPYAPFAGTLPLGHPEPGTIYSWVLNNVWDTNFPTEQGGEMRFRYAIASCSEGPVAQLGGLLADSLCTPLVAVVDPGSSNDTLLEGSFCEIERPEVRLLQASDSRRGDRVLFWLNNASDEEIETDVRFPDLTVKSAQLSTVFEENVSESPLIDGATRLRLQPGETRALGLAI